MLIKVRIVVTSGRWREADVIRNGHRKAFKYWWWSISELEWWVLDVGFIIKMNIYIYIFYNHLYICYISQ